MTWKICEEANKNITDGEFTVLCYNEEEAEKLSHYLNEKYGNWQPVTEKQDITTIPYDDELDLHKDFVEWDELIHWINKTSRRLIEIEEIYQAESKIILSEAVENGVDFKRLYGGNNASTRKQYVDEQLVDLIDEKQELKFLQADDLRRIEFLKKLIQMKIKVIDVDKGVEL